MKNQGQTEYERGLQEHNSVLAFSAGVAAMHPLHRKSVAGVLTGDGNPVERLIERLLEALQSYHKDKEREI